MKEWREWGKQAYKGRASMMRGNSHHPDYDTREKREAIHDANEQGIGESAYNWTDEGRAKLKSRWNYTDAEIESAKQAWIDGYSASRKWYKREDAKHQAVLDSFASLFAEASKIAYAVDVSDIKDGFPCGWAIISLDYACRDTELGKALAHFNDASTPTYKYQIRIKSPSYGQCVSFSERINGKVCDFLRSRGMLANSHTVID